MVNNLDTLILKLKEDSIDLYHAQNSEEFSFENGAEDSFVEKIRLFENNVQGIEFSSSQQIKLRRLLNRINAYCSFNQGILVKIYF